MFDPNVDAAAAFETFLVGDFILDFIVELNAEFLFIIELKLTRSEKLEGLAAPALTFFLGDPPITDFAPGAFFFGY